jgi:hypothetical protein
MSVLPVKLTYEQLRAVNVARIEGILTFVSLPRDITSPEYGRNDLLQSWALRVLDDKDARIIAARLPKYMPTHTLAWFFGATAPKHDWGIKHIWVTLYSVFQMAKATTLDHDNYTIHAQIEQSNQVVSNGTNCDLPDKIGGVTHRDASVTARPLPAGRAPAMAAEAAAADHSAAAASSCATVSGKPSPALMKWGGEVGAESVETFAPINVI